jgi:flotillin
MYGDGNTSKMVEDITKSANQVSAGMLDGIGIDLKSMINSFITGKAIGQGIGSTSESNGTDGESKPTDEETK